MDDRRPAPNDPTDAPAPPRGSAEPPLVAVRRASKRARRPDPFSDAWQSLSREIEHCVLCRLHRTRTHAVVYRGAAHPRVVFVGEAPGAEEDRTGVPFVGRSGRLLDQAIARLGLPEAEVGVLNIVKCRPPGNTFVPAAAAACRPYLLRQLALLAPEIIVTLGGRALSAFDPAAPPVARSAGAVRRVGSIRLFPLLHPAASFRAARYRRQWDRDLGILARELPRGRRWSEPL